MDKCPSCNVGLTYLKNGKRIRRSIAITVPSVRTDVALYYRCPDCGHEWHTWQDPVMQTKVLPYLSTKKQPQPRRETPNVSPSSPAWHAL